MTTMTIPDFDIIPAEWGPDCDRLLSVRRIVFVIEQQVPEEMEIDEFDPLCFHVLAIDTTRRQPIGTARLLPDGRIGRVAVLKEWRKRGVGLALMKSLIAQCRAEERKEVTLNAQIGTLEFYQKLGFVSEGKEFEEAGILHRTMRLRLI